MVCMYIKVAYYYFIRIDRLIKYTNLGRFLQDGIDPTNYSYSVNK